MKQINTNSWENTTKEFKEDLYNNYAPFFLTESGVKYKEDFERKAGVKIFKNENGRADWKYDDKVQKE